MVSPRQFPCAQSGSIFEKIRHLRMTERHGHVQRGAPIFGARLRVCAVLQQQLGHLHLSGGGGCLQRREIFGLAGIYVGPVLDERSCHFEVLSCHR